MRHSNISAMEGTYLGSWIGKDRILRSGAMQDAISIVDRHVLSTT
jgi:hypothetical protein